MRRLNIPDHPIAMSHQIHTYTELKQQIHEELRAQHPEWVEQTGECLKCDEHEARLRELLDSLMRKESNESVITTRDKPKTIQTNYENLP
jgi:hypothetical protein